MSNKNINNAGYGGGSASGFSEGDRRGGSHNNTVWRIGCGLGSGSGSGRESGYQNGQGRGLGDGSGYGSSVGSNRNGCGRAEGRGTFTGEGRGFGYYAFDSYVRSISAGKENE